MYYLFYLNENGLELNRAEVFVRFRTLFSFLAAIEQAV